MIHKRYIRKHIIAQTIKKIKRNAKLADKCGNKAQEK